MLALSSVHAQLRRLPAWGWAVLFIFVHALIWTGFAVLGGNANLHGDSLEAFTWGQEFQLGYYKHPPFWAWIAGLWFKLFPHKDWAFYFLSEANAALGIVGVWAFLGCYTRSPVRLAATGLLLLTSFYTFNALRFNANTIQLSLWPWTMYFLASSLERRTLISGLWLGACAAAAFLSKYYAGVLLLTCFVAALQHKKARAYYRSPAPWGAAVAFCVLVAPHFFWLWHNDFLPFTYAVAQTEYIKKKFFYTSGGFVTACVAFHAVQAFFILALRFASRQKGDAPVAAEDARFLLTLGLLPVFLTLLVSLAGGRVTPNYVLPIFSMSPLLLLMALRPDPRLTVRAVMVAVVALIVSCLAAAPFLHRLSSFEQAIPRQEMAEPSIAAWAGATQAPLRLVGGTQPFSEAAAFYAPPRVSHFPELTYDDAPWVSPERIAREGLLIMCARGDLVCFKQAEALVTSDSKRAEITVTPRRGKHQGPPITFTFFAIPPR